MEPYRNIDAIGGFSFWQVAMTAISLSQLRSSYCTKTRIKATHSLLRKCTMYRPKGEHNSDKPFWLLSRINIPIRLHKQSNNNRYELLMTIMHWYMAVTAQWLFYNYTMTENYTFLRNESQFLKFLYFRQVVVSAKCLFGEKSARHTVRSTKCPFD